MVFEIANNAVATINNFNQATSSISDCKIKYSLSTPDTDVLAKMTTDSNFLSATSTN